LRVGHKALQCTNKQAMILWYHRKIESKSDESEDDDISPLEDCNDRDVEYLVEGKLLLNVQTKEGDVE
jgi:hypothetical protein